ncbi:metallothionein [Roseibium sp.]|uniref:metallothionein n=1 Tax=Roseibium sp. TaxID=1936156 RepID=UPI0039EE1D7A
MVTVTQQKCACVDCVCIVNIDDAIKKNDQNYCSEACANGHTSGSGCDHQGCKCCGGAS